MLRERLSCCHHDCRHAPACVYLIHILDLSIDDFPPKHKYFPITWVNEVGEKIKINPKMVGKM